MARVYRSERGGEKESQANTHNDCILRREQGPVDIAGSGPGRDGEHETETGREVGNSPTASCHHSRSLQACGFRSLDEYLPARIVGGGGEMWWKWNGELDLFVTSYTEGEYYFCYIDTRTFVFGCLLRISRVVTDHRDANIPQSIHKGRERNHGSDPSDKCYQRSPILNKHIRP